MPTDSLKELETTVFPTTEVTEKYSPEVIVKKNKRDPNIINCDIGNSGLVVRISVKESPAEYTFNYYPNIKKGESNKDTRFQKSIIFGSALLSFRNWLNDPINQKEYDFDNNSIGNLSNFTNPKMANFIKILFSKNNHPEIVEIDEKGKGTLVKIDLKKFCKLQKEDELIQYLKRLDNRARNITLTYDKEIF